MRIEYAALTDIGLKRSTNEDAFMIESELVSVKDPDKEQVSWNTVDITC